MELINVTAQAYLSAAIIGLVLCTTYACHYFKYSLNYFVAIAALVTCTWLIAMTHHIGQELSESKPAYLSIIQGLHYFAWITALTRLLNDTQNKKNISTILLWWSGLAIIAALTIITIYTNSKLLAQSTILLLALTSLVCVEQLYRNTTYNRYIKLMSLCLGILFVFDSYLYAHEILVDNIDQDLLQARAALFIAVFVSMSIGALSIQFNHQSPAKINLSRPVVFYTTSIAIIGILGSLLIVGGYYMQLYSGRLGNLVYSGGLFLAIIVIAIIYTSGAIRDQVSVFINKHLFLHKYDYRTEWLRLISRLSSTLDKESAYKQALTSVSDLFKSGGGLLWLKQGEQFQPVFTEGAAEYDTLWVDATDSEFCKTLQEHEWVFIPDIQTDCTLTQYNNLMPEWVNNIEGIWFIMPLVTENQLIGFIGLTKPLMNHHLSWEDLDLIKTVGRQVGDYLYRQQQTEELTEAQQFETFSKLTAFVMHDLKNLIAQQALVVENAAKHKDNPAFIEDAINTIDNSVSRMHTLLKKLRQEDVPEEITNFSLKNLLMAAVGQCQGKPPSPNLHLPENDLFISADFDKLSMAFIHLIQNAQDATSGNNSYVDVHLTTEGTLATITIADNGMGMDKLFIRDKLFKPFETTKSGKGMGIGVYQARSTIESLNGTVSVISTPNEGTTFTITLSGNLFR